MNNGMMCVCCLQKELSGHMTCPNSSGALQEAVQEAGCMGFRKKSTRSLVEVWFSLTCEK